MTSNMQSAFSAARKRAQHRVRTSALGVALDSMQASRGRWANRDVFGFSLYVNAEHQDMLCQLAQHANKPLSIRNLRDMGIARIGSQNLPLATGFTHEQVDAIQDAYDSDPEATHAALADALEFGTACELQGVSIDMKPQPKRNSHEH